ncbi:hypothetical protein AHiyo1_12090 [Arthrobacter sp. Hiyo1]|nr:hypothetical protein AHiyo1_12090 [Arthrobacter sp. Hiyo1]
MSRSTDATWLDFANAAAFAGVAVTTAAFTACVNVFVHRDSLRAQLRGLPVNVGAFGVVDHVSVFACCRSRVGVRRQRHSHGET